MQVYIVLDISRVALPVRGVYSCATDAAETLRLPSDTRTPIAYVAIYNLNEDVKL